MLERLVKILADGELHSGTEIGRSLGVSRAAVWKAIGSLESLGLEVCSAQSRGYRLSRPIDLLCERTLYAELGSMALMSETHISLHFSLDSTNSYLSGANIPVGKRDLVCLSEYQTAGRGRRGRQWESPFGANLYLSLKRQIHGGYASLQGLSLSIGVGVACFLELLGVQGVALKWPNDILVEGKKICGILIELSGESNGPVSVVVGVGLNVSMPEQCAARIDQPVTSLDRCLSHLPTKNALAVGLIAALGSTLDRFESHGFSAFQASWLERDALLGNTVILHRPEGEVSAIYRGVDAGGAALVEMEGLVRGINSGELTIRRL